MSDPVVQTPPPTVDASSPREIAPGVFNIDDRRIFLVPNIGIILGSHSALVIDTGLGKANGERVLAAAKELAGPRKLFLTLTHFHPEHGYGAEVFKGEAEIICNRAQAEDLSIKGEDYLQLFKGMNPDVADALTGTRLVEADTVYDGPEHEIDLGGRRIVFKTWGMAHTRGDQIIYLPDERIIFMGDLAEERFFPIFPWFPPHDVDVNAENWVRVLNACLDMQPKIVVPGHGGVGGTEILTDVRDYILDVATKVQAAVGTNKSDDEIVATLAPQIKAEHPDWQLPEWIDFAIRYNLSVQ